jgi:hypothetical protein
MCFYNEGLKRWFIETNYTDEGTRKMCRYVLSKTARDEEKLGKDYAI